MSSQVRTLVHTLQAAGSISGKDGICLLTQVENRLVEKVYAGDAVKMQRKAAGNVRKDASAAYLTLKDKTLLVTIGENNTLQCSEFVPGTATKEDEDDEDDEQEEDKWEKANLKGVTNIAVHQKSSLASVVMPDHGAMVFFQDNSGKIQSLRYASDQGGWGSTVEVPANATAGTPLAAFITDTALFVSYLNQDGNVHCLRRDFETGAWKDNALPNSKFTGHVDKIAISQDSETGAFEAFVLSEGTVTHVKKDGTRSTLGTVKGAEFTPNTQAQSSVYIGGNNFGNITVQDYHYNYNYTSNNYSYSGGYGGYGCYYPRPRCGPCW